MADPLLAGLARWVNGARIPAPTFDGPQIGKVATATSTTVTFTVPDFDEHVLFGPAPHPGTGTPPAGTECLVLFIGPGADRPYVAAFYGWTG